MTDQNTTPDAEAVERVEEAMFHGLGPTKSPDLFDWDTDADRETLLGTPISWEEWRDGEYRLDYDGQMGMSAAQFRRMATAAIQAHTAHLWERAMQPDVVEAAARAMYFSEANSKAEVMSAFDLAADFERHVRFYQGEGFDPMGQFPAFLLANKALTTFLTALLGPRPEGARDAD